MSLQQVRGLSGNEAFLIDIVESNGESVFSVLTEKGIFDLIRSFYDRVYDDDDEELVRMFRGIEKEDAVTRLASFLVQRFGGPKLYANLRGPPALRRRHGKFAVTETASQRWYELITEAMDHQKIQGQTRIALNQFFGDTARFLVNRRSKSDEC